MLEIQLNIDNEIVTYTAPTKREELRLKHFCGYLIILEQFQNESKELDTELEKGELTDRGFSIKKGMVETAFQSKLVSLMLDVDWKTLEEQIGFKELEVLSKEFDWMIGIDFGMPSDKELENLPETITIDVDGQVYELETDLDSMTIQSMASIEELLATLASDYFKQFHYILAILILAKKNIYDIKQTQVLGKQIWDSVYLSSAYSLIFFLGFGRQEYSLHTRVCLVLGMEVEAGQWKKRISETVSTDRK